MFNKGVRDGYFAARCARNIKNPIVAAIALIPQNNDNDYRLGFECGSALVGDIQ